MNNFSENFKRAANITETENGGRTFSTTGDGALLDLFAKIGGMRDRSKRDIINSWLAARKENKELADNMVLYARDIRNGGLGERRIGRILLTTLAKIEPEKIIRNFDKIIDAGRWDDIYCFVGTPVETTMWAKVNAQLIDDLKGIKKNAPISLLGKWLKSCNTSSKETKELGTKTRIALNLTETYYRKMLSRLRKYIDVVERKMSAGEWDKINYEAVPAVAMSRYINAYNKHYAEKFIEYKRKLASNEVKVNATVLYPYDIAKKCFHGIFSGFNASLLDEIDIAQWENLPNYVNEKYSVIIMADVSGSMTTNNYRPIATSIGLATYFAQRNQGDYHNMYMSFSSDPHFIHLHDNMSLEECFDYVLNKDIGFNTDLDKAMKAIYDIAKQSHDAPKALVVISDGEFDAWPANVNNHYESILTRWKREFENIGLKSPKVISWNVANRNDNYIAPSTDNIAYISGYGAAAFKNLTTLIEKNAYEAMVEILSQPQFALK